MFDKDVALYEREGGVGQIARILCRTTHLISVVDLLAFGVWTNGKLTRSLWMAPDSGMGEFGPRLPFEEPYWAGERPLDLDDEDSEYPFPFHPLELGESALLEFFGYQLEGDSWEQGFDPETIPLLRFKRVQEKPWWKFW